THLIAGLLVAGLGIGMINVPLASTAVGVVRPERAGMASGVNSTARQVGIATGIAALGSIFSHHIASGISDRLSTTPMDSHSGQIADAVTGGQLGQVVTQVPPGERGTIIQAATASFVDSLNHITMISAALAFATGVACLFLIRQRDFEAHHGGDYVAETEDVPTGGAISH
ncbi:MAG TPA: MFS transporter, partial [Nocardioidaceae bacterium]